MLDRPYFIYTITHRETGRVYVGLSQNIDARWKQHRYSATFMEHPLYDAIRDFGIEAFDFAVIDQVEGRMEAHSREIEYMERLGSLVPAGFNKRPYRREKASLQVRVERRITDILQKRRSHRYTDDQISDIAGVVANAVSREIHHG